MKLLRIIPLALVLAAGVAHADGSGGGGGGNVASDDVKRWLVFWDKLVDTVVTDKDACPKMGTDVNALIDANKDLLAMAQKAKADGKQLPADAQQHMKDSLPKLMSGMMNCAKDATVKGAFQRLKLGGPHDH
jgi:hypothetical protein